jgi:hypothetical protein
MKQLPKTTFPLVLRIDFSSQSQWDNICAEIRKPVGDDGFLADVVFLDDEAYKDITKQQLLDLVPRDYPHTFIMLVDRTSISDSGSPLLIVDLYDEPGREFRAGPSEIQGIQNNLSLANMAFYEFANNVDDDGIFRGFK